MTILSATVKIMKNIYDTFTKTPYVGTTTNYTPKNRSMGFARNLCKTKAKPAIKQLKTNHEGKGVEIILNLSEFLMTQSLLYGVEPPVFPAADF